MNQKHLKDLLKEASQLDCPEQRRNEILYMLREGALRGGGSESMGADSREGGVRAVLEALYEDTVKNRPEVLPDLFPSFAVMCGFRNGSIIAEVDWSLI